MKSLKDRYIVYTNYLNISSFQLLKIDSNSNSVTNNFHCRKCNLSKVNWDITELNWYFTEPFTIRVVGPNLDVF